MVRRGSILSVAHPSDWAAAGGGPLDVWVLRGVAHVLKFLECAYVCGNLVVERADCVQTALSGWFEVSPVRGVQGVVVNRRAGQLVVGTEAFCRR
jgi:hypothetical protein